MSSWNNPKAAELDEARRKLYAQVMETVLSNVINMATKRSIETRYTPDAKPTKEIVIAKLTQDFTHQMFQNALNISSTIDALILDFPIDNFLTDDPNEKMSAKTLSVDTRKYLHDKIGKDATKRLRDNRVMEVMALLVAYLFAANTTLFNEVDRPEQADETAFSIFYLFNETVIGFLKAMANTSDIAKLIVHSDNVNENNLTPFADFIDRIQANTKLYEGVLNKAKFFTDEFKKEREIYNAPDNNGRSPPSN